MVFAWVGFTSEHKSGPTDQDHQDTMFGGLSIGQLIIYWAKTHTSTKEQYINTMTLSNLDLSLSLCTNKCTSFLPVLAAIILCRDSGYQSKTPNSLTCLDTYLFLTNPSKAQPLTYMCRPNSDLLSNRTMFISVIYFLLQVFLYKQNNV